ncbi:MAG: flagellar biosynthesis protein FlhF [Rhodoferax sp.]
MNIQRFTAPTAREALQKARLAFGDATVILSNRQTPQGIEVLATGEDTLQELDQGALNLDTPRSPVRPAVARTDTARPVTTPGRADPNSAVLDDAAQLAMSTLSFQDYVRERMLRRRHEAITGQPLTARPSLAQIRAEGSRSEPIRIPPLQPQSAPAAPRRAEPKPARISAPAAPVQPPTVQTPASSSVSANVMGELQAMKQLIEERFNTLTWLGQARQNPIQSNLMYRLIQAGYSPTLVRTILERLPEGFDPTQAQQWVSEILIRNLHTDHSGPAIYEEGGIYALVGATGVGKTTTAAKIAGLCARTHGANSVGLITLDTYRVGAHEQLRAYGRMLGVVAHLAHDRAALQDLLGLLANKKMVLIDTTGIAPNDPRKREMLEMLDLPGVNRLMVLNAGSHGDTLEDVVHSFKAPGTAQALLSKTDEAVKIAPALDAVIRHQLVLRGITTGQKVPEDWERADAARLVGVSLRTPARSVWDPAQMDLGFFFAQSSASTLGVRHA